MHITINSIKYKKNYPLIWEYDEEQNVATCLFEITGDPKGKINCNKFLIIDYLKTQSISGLTISEDRAIISELNTLYDKKEITILSSTQVPPIKMQSLSQSGVTSISPRNKSPLERSRSDRTGACFFDQPPLVVRKNTLHSIASQRTIPKSPRQPTPSKKIKENKAKSIQFDDVLPETLTNATLLGNTKRYDSYFSKKNKDDSVNRGNPEFDSAISFSLKLQYLKNQELHPIKEMQIALIRLLLDHVFAPAYPKKPDASLIEYLQKIIEQTMLNSKHNSGPTPIEEMPEEKRKLEFNDDSTKIKTAIFLQLRARAQLMMQEFLYFVSDEIIPIPIEDLTDDEYLRTELAVIKAAVQNHELIKEALLFLELLIVKSGRIAYKFDLIEGSIAKMQGERKDLLLTDLLVEHEEIDWIKINSAKFTALVTKFPTDKEEENAKEQEKSKEPENLREVAREEEVNTWIRSDGYSVYNAIFLTLDTILPKESKVYRKEQKVKNSKVKANELRSREVYINSLSQAIIKQSIDNLNEIWQSKQDNQCFPKMFNTDGDLYFSAQWIREFKAQLQDIERSLEGKFEKYKHKNRDNLIKKMTSCLVEFVGDHIQHSNLRKVSPTARSRSERDKITPSPSSSTVIPSSPRGRIFDRKELIKSKKSIEIPIVKEGPAEFNYG